MAAYNKFDIFVQDLLLGRHVLNAANDVIKVYLTNNVPNNTSHTVFNNLPEFAGGTGYTTNGNDIQNDVTLAGNIASLTGNDVVWTAGAADWANFRYVPIYNSTNAKKPLISWWDYGSTVTLGNGETFTLDLGASVFTLQ